MGDPPRRRHRAAIVVNVFDCWSKCDVQNYGGQRIVGVCKLAARPDGILTNDKLSWARPTGGNRGKRVIGPGRLRWRLGHFQFHRANKIHMGVVAQTWHGFQTWEVLIAFLGGWNDGANSTSVAQPKLQLGSWEGRGDQLVIDHPLRVLWNKWSPTTPSPVVLDKISKPSTCQKLTQRGPDAPKLTISPMRWDRYPIVS